MNFAIICAILICSAPLHAGGLVLPAGRQSYGIMSGTQSVKITEAVIDPLDVHVGDVQTMTVKTRSKDPVVSVNAVIRTDNMVTKHKLKLAEGTPLEGTWKGSWEVFDTHSAAYSTVFTATDKAGESALVTLSWTDPCTPPAGGDWTLDGNCGFSGVHGVDNGNITVNNAAYTLTINAGATFAWNSAKSISITAGSIAISNTGQMKQTNLWMVDADADNWAVGSQVAQDSSPGGSYRRRNVLSSYSTLDCYDANANARPGSGSWSTVHRGDGSFDFNCDGQQTIEIDVLACDCDTAGWNACGGDPPGCGSAGSWNVPGCISEVHVQRCI